MQIRLKDIHPLTDFQRNAKAHIARINRTGRPEVLTVNGKAEAVLLGAGAYERMLVAMEELETIQSIRRGLEELDEGNTVSAAEVHEELRRL